MSRSSVPMPVCFVARSGTVSPRSGERGHERHPSMTSLQIGCNFNERLAYRWTAVVAQQNAPPPPFGRNPGNLHTISLTHPLGSAADQYISQVGVPEPRTAEPYILKQLSGHEKPESRLRMTDRTVCHTRLEPQTSKPSDTRLQPSIADRGAGRQGRRQVLSCYSHMWASPWTGVPTSAHDAPDYYVQRLLGRAPAKCERSATEDIRCGESGHADRGAASRGGIPGSRRSKAQRSDRRAARACLPLRRAAELPEPHEEGGGR